MLWEQFHHASAALHSSAWAEVSGKNQALPQRDSLELSYAPTSCLEAWITFGACMAVKFWVVLGSQGKAGWTSSTWWEMLCEARCGGHPWLPSPEGSAGLSHLGARVQGARVQLLVLLPSLKPWGAPRAAWLGPTTPSWALLFSFFRQIVPSSTAETPPSLPVWVFVTPQSPLKNVISRGIPSSTNGVNSGNTRLRVPQRRAPSFIFPQCCAHLQALES